MEYSQRPVLVPPFIIFNHVIHALRGLYHWLKNCLGRGKRNQEESSYGLSMASLCEWNNILINKTEKSLSTPVTIRSSTCSDFSQLSYRDMLGRVFEICFSSSCFDLPTDLHFYSGFVSINIFLCYNIFAKMFFVQPNRVCVLCGRAFPRNQRSSEVDDVWRTMCG